MEAPVAICVMFVTVVMQKGQVCLRDILKHLIQQFVCLQCVRITSVTTSMQTTHSGVEDDDEQGEGWWMAVVDCLGGVT